MMTLKKLVLDGFLSYKEKTEIEFPEDTIVIIGENGAGKTSIVEAIYYALTGSPLRGTLDSVVNSKTKTMKVELTLRTPDGEIKIARSRDRVAGRTEAIVIQDGRIIARTSEAANKIIAERIIGVEGEKGEAEKKTVKNILDLSIIRQGLLAELSDKLSSRSQEKEKQIDILLGLDRYEKAYTALREYEVKITYPHGGEHIPLKPPETYRVTDDSLRLITSYQLQIDKTLKEVKEKKRKAGEEKKKLEEKLKTLEEAISRAEEELAKALEEEKLLEEKKEEYIKTKSLLLKERTELEKTEKTIQELENILFKKKEIEKEKEEREKQLEEKKKRLEKYLLIQLLTTIQETVKAKEKQKELLRKHNAKGIEEVLDKLRGMEREIAITQKNAENMKNLEKKLEHVREEKEKIIEEIKKTAPWLEEEEPERIIKNIPTKISALSRKLAGLEEKKNFMEERIKETLEIIEELRKNRGRCPVCGHKLTEKRIKQLIEEKARLISKLRRELEETEKESSKLKNLLAELDKIRESLEKLSSLIHQERLVEKELQRIKEEAWGDLKELLEAKKEIEKDHKELVIIEKTLAEREGELKILLERIFAAGLTLRTCTLNLFDERCIDEIEEKIEKRKDVEEESIDARELEELEKRIEELDKKLERTRQLEEEYERKIREREERKTRIRVYLEKLSGLGNIEEEIEIIKKKIEEKRASLQLLREEKRASEENSKILEEEINIHGKTINYLEKMLEELSKAEYVIRVLLYIRNLYQTENLPQRLRSYAIRMIEENMKDILSEFELSYDDIEITDRLDVKLFNRNASISRELGQCSGGEKTAVVLSFILALKKTIQEIRGSAQSMGFMILDEPTLYLDKDRRAGLLEVLRKARHVSRLPQLMIITHDDELKEAGDTVFLVEKNAEGVSSIKRIYG